MKTLYQSSMLEILFEGRNKLYGAYELRAHYPRRLWKSILFTFTGLAIFLSLSVVIGKTNIKKGKKFDPEGHTLVIPPADIPEDVVTPPPPEVPPVEEIKIETTKFAKPVVTADELVAPEDEMNDMADMQDTKIGLANVDGIKAGDIVAPPIEEGRGSGIIESPKIEEDAIKLIVDIQATYPGGLSAWTKFISREINRNINELEEDGKSGQCIVQFVVDVDGTISNVEALTLKGTKLAELSVNAIRKGPNWIPAELNGKKVKAYRKQPVSFKLLSE